MVISDKGRKIIKHFEGYENKAYYCTSGTLTIGYGSTRVNGLPVRKNQTITKSEAQKQFDSDIDIFSFQVLLLIGDSEVTQQQFDAMVSLAYNIGNNAFKRSNVLKYHKQGNFKKASNSFKWWRKSNNKVNRGLERRRRSEKELYLYNKLVFNFKN